MEIRAVYQGDLQCRVTHGLSGQSFLTDAPPDNQGQGRAISPTDLLAGALGSCILTVMGIVAARHGIELAGATVRIEKTMTSQPVRRVASLRTTVIFPRPYAPQERALLERSASACPVHHSLHPDIQAPIEFVYPE